MLDRLSKTDWLDHGLRTLADAGANAIKVAPLAAALKVSRGSFYWHFQDIGDFHAALLQCWQQRATDQIIAELEAIPVTTERLSRLLKRTMQADHRLERAIRYWAVENPGVAKIVATVDAARIGYIAKMLSSGGITRRKAVSRAMFLYWAFLGKTVIMDPRSASMAQPQIDEIVNAITTEVGRL